MTKWCGVLLASQIPQMPQKPPKVTLEITDTGLAINGKDLELCLSLSSKHSAPRELSVHLIGQAMRYTGVYTHMIQHKCPLMPQNPQIHCSL